MSSIPKLELSYLQHMSKLDPSAHTENERSFDDYFNDSQINDNDNTKPDDDIEELNDMSYIEYYSEVVDKTDNKDKQSSSQTEKKSHSIIYEINVSVPRDKAEKYIEWLKPFTMKQCEIIEGFISCTIYSQPKPVGIFWLSEEGQNKAYFTIAYTIDSEENFLKYNERNQNALSKSESDEFGFLVTSRRVLRSVF